MKGFEIFRSVIGTCTLIVLIIIALELNSIRSDFASAREKLDCAVDSAMGEAKEFNETAKDFNETVKDAAKNFSFTSFFPTSHRQRDQTTEVKLARP